jgi:hypothetical protein
MKNIIGMTTTDTKTLLENAIYEHGNQYKASIFMKVYPYKINRFIHNFENQKISTLFDFCERLGFEITVKKKELHHK